MRTETGRRRAVLTFAAAALVLVAPGCAGSPPSSAVPPGPTSSTTADPTAVGTVFGPRCDLLPQGDVPGSVAATSMQLTPGALASSPLVSKFAAGFQTSEMLAKLNGQRPATVFAPTNAAMAAFKSELGSDFFDSMVNNEQSLLTFTRHNMIGRKLSRADLLTAGTVTALDGDSLSVVAAGDTITVGDPRGRVATVLCGGIPTRNGTIYIINNVLVSPESQFSHINPHQRSRCAPNHNALNDAELCFPTPSPASSGNSTRGETGGLS